MEKVFEGVFFCYVFLVSSFLASKFDRKNATSFLRADDGKPALEKSVSASVSFMIRDSAPPLP